MTCSVRVHGEEDKPCRIVAVGRTSKCSFGQIVQKATTGEATTFLDALVEALPRSSRDIAERASRIR